MNSLSLIRVIAGILLIFGVFNAQAAQTLRCNGELVQEGALTMQVLRKCGQPDSREFFDPALRPDGVPINGAVTVEIWSYGPENGVYRYLRFIEGRLVKIWSEPR